MLDTALDFTDPDTTIFTLYGYDSRGNRSLTIDPKANTTATVFDGASRAIETRQHMRQQGEGVNPPAANRTFTSTGESGGTIGTKTLYDANGRTAALVDDHGNTTLYQYDTLDREIAMSFPASGGGATRTTVYDAASDVIQRIDANGSIFDYAYDAMGRRLWCQIARASAPGNPGYNVLGTTFQYFEYDGLSRQTASVDAVSPTYPSSSSSSDSGNLSSLSSSSSGSATGEDSARCRYYYDSLSRVVEDSQSYHPDGGSNLTRNVTNDAFTSTVVTGFTYPNDRRTENTYDLLYRRTQVMDRGGESESSSSSSSGGSPSSEPNPPIASWEFFGPSRVAEVNLANGLACTFMNNDRTHSAVQENVALPTWGSAASDRLGYDGAGRMIAKRYVPSELDGSGAYVDTTPVVAFTTRYDKASNKFFERELHAENRSHLYIPDPSSLGPDPSALAYGIDSINRRLQYQRGTLADGGGSVVDPITLPGTDSQRGYDLDHLGNWKKTTYKPVSTLAESSSSSSGSADVDTLETDRRDHNALNQITRRKPTNASAWDIFAYDLNGNLLDDGERLMEYDAFNRLKRVKRKSDDAVISEYAYDAGGRRVRTVVSNGGLSGTITNGTTDFLYTSQQCVEERDVSDVPTKQYVWGIYIDDLIQQRDDPDGVREDRCSLRNLLYTARALTDATGDIVETYDTDAYGNTLIYDGPGTGDDWWADDAVTTNEPACDFIFTGRRYDSETTIYFYRARYYNQQLGRFLSGDALLFVDGIGGVTSRL